MRRSGSAPTSTLAWALAWALTGALAPARAQDGAERVAGLLRTASTQSAIIVFCAKIYDVDGTTALRISQTSRDVAVQVLGKAAADAAFKAELARRYDEVRAAGEAQWCAEQRDAFADDGSGIFRN